MHLHYQSNYSNEVHQLIVCVSKHLYATKTGLIKQQQKSFDLSLAKVDKTEKEHVVHYLIRDHFSGVFYAEIHSSKALIPVEEFLFRAWSPKQDYPFHGMPECILVPKTVSDRFPSINRLICEYDIAPIEVTCGFQSGTIQDVKTWESHVRQLSNLGTLSDILQWQAEILQKWTPVECAKETAWLNNGLSNRDSKIEKWRDRVTEIRVPPSQGWQNKAPARAHP
jgi:hypothetical protein